MSTSISDSAAYRAACLKAATDPEAFKVFKRDPALNYAWEHVTYEEGLKYFELLCEPERRYLLSNVDAFRRNDDRGSPRTFAFGPWGEFSPTTLRYMFVLSDLIARFGTLRGKFIMEIGGGYGGQAYVAEAFFGQLNWGIVDLQETCDLQRAYMPVMTFPTGKALPTSCDLVISNYAFSELTSEVQVKYLDAFVRKAKHGYMLMNSMNGLSKEQLLREIPHSRSYPHLPDYSGVHGLWLWTW